MELSENACREVERRVVGIVGDMHPELLKRTLRSALRRVGNDLRAKAETRFDAEVPGLAGRVRRAINLKVHRDLSGFRVRVLRSGEKAMVRNRRGLLKPLPLFFEHGGMMDGSERSTLGRRPGNMHSTGKIPAAKVMEKIEAETPNSKLEQAIIPAAESYAQKIIDKYGC